MQRVSLFFFPARHFLSFPFLVWDEESLVLLHVTNGNNIERGEVKVRERKKVGEWNGRIALECV